MHTKAHLRLGIIGWRILWQSLAIWLCMLIAISLLMGLLYRSEARHLVHSLHEKQWSTAFEAGLVINARLDWVLRDLQYASHHPPLGRLLAAEDASDRHETIEDFRSLMSARIGIYDQMRYLSEQGREQIRIDNTSGTTQVVPESQLQDKSDRPYFIGARDLSANGLYLSRFDLNVEHGEIEIPYKPMIRFVSRVADARGTERGLMVINYLGQPLLQRLRDLACVRAVNLWLLDREGYWLMASDERPEWDFMFADRSDARVPSWNPALWRAIQDQIDDRSSKIDEDIGLLSAIEFRAARDLSIHGSELPDAPRNRWLLVSWISPDELAAKLRPHALTYLQGWIWLAALSALASTWIAYLGVKRHQANEELKSRKNQLTALIEGAPDGILISDGEGRILQVNAQMERLFGYERAELIGQAVEMLVPQPLRSRHEEYRADYMRERTARAMAPGIRLQGVRKDGSALPLAISLSTVETPQGSPLVISDIRDISEIQATEDALRDALEQTATANRELIATNHELEAFSYSVSHDLRAPLRALDGFSAILVKTYADRIDATGQDYLGRIRAAAQHMGELIDDILSLSRITRIELQRERIDLSAMAREILADLHASEPDRKIETRIEPELNAYADARLIHVALQNLLANAWKFTSKTQTARIEFGCQETDEGPAFFVRDNGAGFDMAYADKLFGAFQRLHQNSDFPGTGIGLATVQRVIRKHGGQIWAKAAVGQGASFHFTIAAP
ncbi:sensor histidine kinase [Thiorhodococcus fuscus]|uniref:histidine kinase n=1 Tax=Thiorhodococcus fuscus TaxID=527200 RepID=A0ABW4YC99_9GAMM